MSRPPQYIHLSPNTSPTKPISKRPFSVVVIIEAEVTPEWRHDISEWLVKEGCLCMMAWGTDCSLWDDSVDVANLKAFNWGDIPKGQSVVTTWHDDEPLNEVFWSAKKSIFNPPDTSIDHLLILDISDKARESEIEDLFAKSNEDDEVELSKSKRGSSTKERGDLTELFGFLAQFIGVIIGTLTIPFLFWMFLTYWPVG